MTKQVQRRRGTSTQHTSFTGAEGEISVNTTNKSIHVHDGLTAGGVEAARADLTNVSDANLNAALSGNTLSSLTITSVDINGGTIDGAVIGGSSPAAGTFTTANATTVDTTNIEVTTLKAKDGTSAGSIADSTGVVTLASSVLTTTDINGGTIDGAVIGGSSAAAGTFTTVTASGDLTIADKIVHSGDTNTAIRFPAADTVTVETSGAERLRITSAGNVGIGTSSFAYSAAGRGLLEVNGSSSALVGLKVGDVAGGYLFDSGSLVIVGAPAGRSIAFDINGERLRLDSSGNLGLGVTPSAWSSSAKAFQFGTYGSLYQNASGYPELAFNTFQNTSNNYIYRNTDVATRYSQTNGQHQWFTAPSGTAGNAITFTQAMTLDASGNLGVGITNPAVKLHLAGSLPFQRIDNNAATSGEYGLRLTAGATDLVAFTYSSTTGENRIGGLQSYVFPTFYSGGTERARITSGGELVLGDTVSLDGSKMYVVGGISQSGNQFNFRPGSGVQYELVNRTGAGFDFYVNSATNLAARIDSSGNLLVGTTSNPDGSRLRVFQSILGPVANVTNERNVSGDIVMLLGNKANANNTNSYYLICQEPDVANRLFIFGNGNVVNLNNSYGALSDEKLKENIIDSGSQWDDLKAVRVRKYSLKADNANGPNQIGVIAQELEAAGMGGLVFESPELGVNNEPTGETIKQVNYSVLYMKAVKALQEAMARIETLEARLDAANL